ncbi:nuclear transport factor 2 family protein [Frankia sp. R82]|uniref:nuclear transport factor 2 family protein n=1 Tax=Frankia sp. R82 TaxID=2950553 RepID=UPI0020433859|nr:nuclear transport factor 2 family protein [Frankia sp. R82]MCM3882576.1 nuclear transport factor 2 family protein [Frankia sp. R82]
MTTDDGLSSDGGLATDDVQAIIGVQNAYAVAIDRRDWSALRGCFAPDARVGFGRPARLGTLEEFLAWAPPFHDALGPTLHQMTTHHAHPRRDGAREGGAESDDGVPPNRPLAGAGAAGRGRDAGRPAVAEASCYLHALLVSADLASCQAVFGRYDDEVVHLAGRWVIRRREFHPIWRNVTTATGTTGAAAAGNATSERETQ